MEKFKIYGTDVNGIWLHRRELKESHPMKKSRTRIKIIGLKFWTINCVFQFKVSTFLDYRRYYIRPICHIFLRFIVAGNPIVTDDLTNYQPTFCNTSLVWADEYSEYCNESNQFSINIIDSTL